MANETIQTTGTYGTAQASSSTADAAISAGAVTKIATAVGATEATYPLLDFKVQVSVGTPVAGDTIDIYRRASDGTNQAPIPQTADFLSQYVGSVLLDNQTGYYYLYGVANPDDEDTYYMVNNGGATLTIVLTVRARTYGNA